VSGTNGRTSGPPRAASVPGRTENRAAQADRDAERKKEEDADEPFIRVLLSFLHPDAPDLRQAYQVLSS
jgi:hypothetical protein